MSSIHRLDHDTVNQIAAGEVVDGPEAIIKELVENSIDAGADFITVATSGGGVKYISVSDNGKGIHQNDFNLAVERHCTSKIAYPADLFDLHTFGFRGEALSSIAAVSNLKISSIQAGATKGRFVLWHHGNIVADDEYGGASGTIIEVSKLFDNVPARKAFLSTERVLNNNIQEVLAAFMLSHPYKTFVWEKENARPQVVQAECSGDLRGALWRRVKIVLGVDESYQDWLYIDQNDGETHVYGFISPLGVSFNTKKKQFLFVNGRMIAVGAWSGIIKKAYEFASEQIMYNGFVLFIILPASFVDVNVHPKKIMVKFRNERAIIGAVVHAVRSRLIGVSIHVAAHSTINKTETYMGGNERSEPENLGSEISRGLRRDAMFFKRPKSCDGRNNEDKKFDLPQSVLSISSKEIQSELGLNLEGSVLLPTNGSIIEKTMDWSLSNKLDIKLFYVIENRYAVFGDCMITNSFFVANLRKLIAVLLTGVYAGSQDVFEIQECLFPVSLPLSHDVMVWCDRHIALFKLLHIELMYDQERLFLHACPEWMSGQDVCNAVLGLFNQFGECLEGVEENLWRTCFASMVMNFTFGSVSMQSCSNMIHNIIKTTSDLNRLHQDGVIIAINADMLAQRFGHE